MRIAGRITAGAMQVASEMIRPGNTPHQVDTAMRKFIEGNGAKPSFLGYGGFPASVCISINDTVIHGIPDSTPFKEGDVVSIDVGAVKDGWHGDMARTFFCGQVSQTAVLLERAAREAFEAGMSMAVPGKRLGDVGAAIEAVALKYGFSVVRDYVGHGIGSHLHEDPDVPNYGHEGRGLRICEGMVLAIEPMLNEGTYRVKVLDDEWTVKTLDGGLSAHYENTVAILADGNEILTKLD